MIRERLKRLTYSDETYHLLNNFTLSIKDKELEQIYAKSRNQRFNRLLPLFAITQAIVLAFIFFQSADI